MASAAVGEEVAYTTIRKSAELLIGERPKLKITRSQTARRNHIDQTLGQMAKMLADMAPYLEVEVQPLVKLAAEQYDEEYS